MPACGLKAAQEWCFVNLDLRQTKAVRMGGNNGGRNSENKKPKLETRTDKNKKGEPKQLLSESDRGTFIDLNSTNINILFQSARALRERSMAIRSQTEVDLFLGTLVKKEDVERDVFSVMRQLRDQLMNIPKRMAPELYKQTSVAELEKKLADEIRSVLESTSKKLLKED